MVANQFVNAMLAILALIVPSLFMTVLWMLTGIILSPSLTHVVNCKSHFISFSKNSFFFQSYSGNPIFLEPFWRQNAASSAIMMAGWHRMGYEFEDGSLISKELDKQIRKLHATVGNAVTEERYIVFGAGSTQLLNAAVHALATDASSPPAKVVASAPYYPVSLID